MPSLTVDLAALALSRVTLGEWRAIGFVGGAAIPHDVRRWLADTCGVRSPILLVLESDREGQSHA